jgi:hypothetical protein
MTSSKTRKKEAGRRGATTFGPLIEISILQKR